MYVAPNIVDCTIILNSFRICGCGLRVGGKTNKGSSINNAIFFGGGLSDPPSHPCYLSFFSRPPPIKNVILSYLRHIFIVLPISSKL